MGPPSPTGVLTIGGQCNLPGAVSPNNRRPLTQHARLELSHRYLWPDKWPTPCFHFLYSWTCAIHEGDFSYQYAATDIRIIEYNAGDGDYSGFPYDEYPVAFRPKTFDLAPLSEGEQATIVKLNEPDCDPDYQFDDPLAERLSIPTHQFGGTPYLLGAPIDQKLCVLCGAEMGILSSIGDEAHSSNEGFFGNEFVQLIFWVCTNCHVISATNFAD